MIAARCTLIETRQTPRPAIYSSRLCDPVDAADPRQNRIDTLNFNSSRRLKLPVVHAGTLNGQLKVAHSVPEIGRFRGRKKKRRYSAGYALLLQGKENVNTVYSTFFTHRRKVSHWSRKRVWNHKRPPATTTISVVAPNFVDDSPGFNTVSPFDTRT